MSWLSVEVVQKFTDVSLKSEIIEHKLVGRGGECYTWRTYLPLQANKVVTLM